MILRFIILLKLTTPYIPSFILIKSKVFFNLICLGFGLERGTKYSQLLTVNKISTKGLNSLFPALYETLSSNFHKKLQ